MFTFLNPLTLWLGALVAIPLAIHFLGRQRLRKLPFPSLLLLQDRFAKSMHRHRLKNLLLLILRTLLILCLVLALANPMLDAGRGRGDADAGARIAIVHNGAYGLLRDGTGADAFSRQRDALRRADSASRGKALRIPILAEGGETHPAERYGSYREPLRRALEAAAGMQGPVELRIPVFAWEDVLPLRDPLAAALRDRPGLRVVFREYPGEIDRMSPFSEVRALTQARTPTLDLRARLTKEAAGRRGKIRARLGDRIFQETVPENDVASVTLPLADGFTAGSLEWVEEDGNPGSFAVPARHFAYRNRGRAILAHAGSPLASLASLGRESHFRAIVHAPSIKDALRLTGAETAQPGAGAKGGAGKDGVAKGGELRMVYLSNERNSDAAAYARLVDFVKRGGRLILGVGGESDIPMLNRFLLQPLRLGRLGGPVRYAGTGTATGTASAGKIPPVKVHPEAWTRLAGEGGPPAPGGLGGMGTVRIRTAFTPDSGASVLLSQEGAPVLAARDFHRGKVLLWTTDVDDLDWTDLGVHPLTPLLHQAFQEGTAEGATLESAEVSDSVATLPVPGEGRDADGLPGAADGQGLEARDPDGAVFQRIRREGTRLRMGPFDRLGLYRVISDGDTTVLAVNLAVREGSEERDDAARKQALLALEGFPGRVATIDSDGSGGLMGAGRPLWRAFILAAILLLFLEGVISSTFAQRRSRP